MLLKQGDGTYTGGPLDVLCILHDVQRDTYHAAFFEEKPFPGEVPAVGDTSIVRLKSKMHHTGGSPDLEGAKEHLRELSDQIEVPPENIWKDPLTWDGEVGIVLVVPNWRSAEARPSAC